MTKYYMGIKLKSGKGVIGKKAFSSPSSLMRAVRSKSGKKYLKNTGAVSFHPVSI